MKRVYVACRLVVCLFVGCSYDVDDGAWTYRWRLDGRELVHRVTLRNQTCDEGTERSRLARQARLERLWICDDACGRAPPETKEACVLRCDARVTFASAHCDPSSHTETWTIPIFVR